MSLKSALLWRIHAFTLVAITAGTPSFLISSHFSSNQFIAYYERLSSSFEIILEIYTMHIVKDSGT